MCKIGDCYQVGSTKDLVQLKRWVVKNSDKVCIVILNQIYFFWKIVKFISLTKTTKDQAENTTQPNPKQNNTH